jgi:hypothetical protein
MFTSLQVPGPNAGKAKQSATSLQTAREAVQAEYPYATVLLDRAPVQGVSLWSVAVEDMEVFTVAYSTRTRRVTNK